jgi:hypothetical protein
VITKHVPNSIQLFLIVCFISLKKLANSSGFTDAELDIGGPTINEESAYRYTSIFQVCISQKISFKN